MLALVLGLSLILAPPLPEAVVGTALRWPPLLPLLTPMRGRGRLLLGLLWMLLRCHSWLDEARLRRLGWHWRSYMPVGIDAKLHVCWYAQGSSTGRVGRR